MYIPLTFEGALQSCLYASGGYEQGFFLSGSDQYAFHIFSATGSGQQLQVLAGSISNVQIAVAGGGGGGGCGVGGAGSGGGGGVIISYNTVLYAGTYTINVGGGGAGGVYSGGTPNPGEAGNGSSITGTNINISVGGGGAGTLSIGGVSGTPNSYSGYNSAGGGAGGPGTAGVLPIIGDNGGPGITASFGLDSFAGIGKVFGAGGNSYNSNNEDAYSQFGLGGKGANQIYTSNGQNGRDGCVILQYKINNYCKNWFNQTGSCGCSEVTFNITQGGGYYPQATGSYAYTPCGTNTFVSGSLLSYFPVTVCAASNSYYQYISNGTDPSSGSGFASGNNCFSASYGVQTCVTQSFVTGSCSQTKIVTFYNSPFYYVPKTGSAIINETLASGYVTYRCVTTGSYQNSNILTYPIGGEITPTASCNTITINTNSTWFNYTNCGGSGVTNGTVSVGQTICVDRSRPISTTAGHTTVSYTIGGNCLSGSFDTGSCGCP